MNRITIPSTTQLPRAVPLGDQSVPAPDRRGGAAPRARVPRRGDTRAAHRLVTANLRFVVKVAYEYRSYGFKMADLIQEGNIGLMKAVQKFDPDKGIRLISLRGVVDPRVHPELHPQVAGRLVKLGTTQAQRKLFFSLARTKRELDKLSAEHGSTPTGSDASKIAKKLHVKPAEVSEMEQRMDGRDLSLDAPMGDDGGDSHVDFVAAQRPGAGRRARRRARSSDGPSSASTTALGAPRPARALHHRAARDERAAR